ncbi:sulfurtransferase TusA family protein [Ancylobacter terrae]|uniref:sulfurtransferase TusA family protein n=1 Tax=Ancylobacter sp. sgz301288 TaxID=3342077 RepID=UPI00385861A7
MADGKRAELDLRGLKCPLPVLRARRALEGMADGDVVELVCTDPMAAIDIPVMVRQRGDVLEQQDADGALLRFRIRRGPATGAGR